MTVLPYNWWLSSLDLATDAELAFILFVAIGANFVGSFLHEAGHWLVARLNGVTRARLVLFPMRSKPSHFAGLSRWIYRHSVLAAIDADDTQILALSRTRRRLVFVAGIITDVALALIANFASPMLHLPFTIRCGIAFGFVARGIGSLALNLVPIRVMKNDGWRILNPDACD